jgi:hypothetical protein
VHVSPQFVMHTFILVTFLRVNLVLGACMAVGIFETVCRQAVSWEGIVQEPRGKRVSAIGSHYQEAKRRRWLRTLVCVIYEVQSWVMYESNKYDYQSKPTHSHFIIRHSLFIKHLGNNIKEKVKLLTSFNGTLKQMNLVPGMGSPIGLYDNHLIHKTESQ